MFADALVHKEDKKLPEVSWGLRGDGHRLVFLVITLKDLFTFWCLQQSNASGYNNIKNCFNQRHTLSYNPCTSQTDHAKLQWKTKPLTMWRCHNLLPLLHRGEPPPQGRVSFIQRASEHTQIVSNLQSTRWIVQRSKSIIWPLNWNLLKKSKWSTTFCFINAHTYSTKH